MAELGSFTKAAQVHNTCCSSVSHAVHDLETPLGLQLLNRTTRNVNPTEGGIAVLGCVTEMLERYDELANFSSESASQTRGRIRLQVPSLLEAMRLASALQRFVKEFPLVSVDLRMTDNGGVLLADTEDMAICVGRQIPEMLIARLLGAISLGMFASPSYLAASGIPAHAGDLKPGQFMPLCYSEDNGPVSLIHSAAGRSISVRTPVTLRCNCATPLVRAAICGVGVVMVPAEAAAEAVHRNELVAVLFGWEAPVLNVDLVYRSRQNRRVRVLRLIDYLVEGMADHTMAGGSLGKLLRFTSTGRLLTPRLNSDVVCGEKSCAAPI